MILIVPDPVTPAVTITGLLPAEAVLVAAEARKYRGEFTGLNDVLPDGTVRLFVTWPDLVLRRGEVPLPDGPAPFRAFLLAIDGWSHAVLT